MKAILERYLLESAPSKKITIKAEYKAMILQNAQDNGSVKQGNFEDAIQGLKLAQFEVFYTIKVSFATNS